jgi:hypothetical protein
MNGFPAGVQMALVPDEAIGRSRSGLSTKIHLALDRLDRPLAVLLTAGQATTTAASS